MPQLSRAGQLINSASPFLLGGANARYGFEMRAARSAANRYYRNGFKRSSNLIDIATTTRNTSSWDTDQSKKVNIFGPNLPAVDTTGLASYEARTNSIRNPTATGAVVGSPGTPPTYWAAGVTPGLTRTVVGFGTDLATGLPYVDYRFAGTPTTLAGSTISLETMTGVAAVSGQTWTAKVFLALVGGSVSNVNIQLLVSQLSSAPAYLADLTAQSSIQALLTSSLKSFGGTILTAAASTAYIQPYIHIPPGATSTPVDITLRVAAPNLKLGSNINDPPILQTNLLPSSNDPSTWESIYTANGVTVSRIATGVEDGIPYADYRWSGTATASTGIGVRLGASNSYPVSPSLQFTSSSYVKLIAGSLTGISLYQACVEYNGSNAYVAETQAVLNGINSASYVRGSATRTMSAAAGFGRTYLTGIFPNGAVINLTVRVMQPQAQMGATATEYNANNGTFGRRSADVNIANVNVPVGQNFTVTGKFIAPALSPGQFPTVFELRDSTNQNNLTIHLDGPTNNLYCVTVSGGSTADYSGGAFDATRAPGTIIGFAVTVENGVVKWSVNGGADKTVPALANGPFQAALTQLGIGCRVVGTQQLNSSLRELAITMRAFTQAERQAASDVTLTHDINFVDQTYSYIGAPYLTPNDLPETTFSRSSTALYPGSNNKWSFAAVDALKLSNAGCLIEEATVNKCINYNAAPPILLAPTSAAAFNSAVSTMGVSGDAAAKFGIIDDTARLRASGFGDLIDQGKLNGRVYCIDNSSGVTAAQVLCYGTAITLIPMAVSAYVVGGSGTVGMHIGTGPNAAFSASNTYQRCVALGTPTNVGAAMRVVANPGQVVCFILNQLEEKTYPTSVVIVAGASASRSADNFISVNDNNPTAYTVVAEFKVPETGTQNGRIWGYDDGTINNRALLYIAAGSNVLQLVVTTAGVEVARIAIATVTPGQTYKVATAIATNDFAAVITGGSVQTDTAGSLPACNQFGYGVQPATGSQFGGVISRIRRFATRKSNAELQALVA